MSVGTKRISQVLAESFEKFLPSLISKNQTIYIKIKPHSDVLDTLMI